MTYDEYKAGQGDDDSEGLQYAANREADERAEHPERFCDENKEQYAAA